jgi:hypothetical protein
MLTDNEREFWRGFLAAEPGFASDGIGSAVDGPNPPDVLCATLSGKKIGVELASWNESEQVKWRKTRKSFEESYLRIIESANHVRPHRIGWVWLHPKRQQVSPQDMSSFREELYEFLTRENGLSDHDWDQPHGASVQNFAGFPTVAEYLESVWIFPRRELANFPVGQNWIKFENSGAASAPSWILGAVVDRILAKFADYEDRNLHVRHKLDELHLVCRYDEQALLAGVVPETSGFDFAGFGLRVGRALSNDYGVFDRIFLFNPYEARKVLQVYPMRGVESLNSTSKCSTRLE